VNLKIGKIGAIRGKKQHLLITRMFLGPAARFRWQGYSLFLWWVFEKWVGLSGH
jgi:hypothetical protein